jgi:hypothetical protein
MVGQPLYAGKAPGILALKHHVAASFSVDSRWYERGKSLAGLLLGQKKELMGFEKAYLRRH